MNLTLSNIQNRVVLAQCCLADMGIRALEYRDQGDDENSECVTKKAFILQFIIKRLRCFLPSIGTKTYTESFTVSNGFSAGNKFSLTYSGYRICPDQYLIGSDVAEADTPSFIAGVINVYNSNNPDEVYATASYTSDTFTISIRVSPRVTTTDVAIESTVVAFTTVFTSEDDGALSDTPTPRLSNDNAKKLIGILDAYCGCQCKDTASEITNDSISRILAIEP